MKLGADLHLEPFLVGPFLVGADGRLSPREPDRQQGFRVSWRGCSVQARLVPQGRLALRAAIGRVPSTAGPARACRAPVFAAVRALSATLPHAWRLGLLPDHRIELASEAAVSVPASAVGLVAEITGFLLRLAPYLDLLEELGAGLPAATAALALASSSGPTEVGRAKAWPG